MISALQKTENAILQLSAETGIPYDYLRFDCEVSQLPDHFMVYFKRSNPGTAFGDGKERSRTVQIQVSFFSRSAAEIETITEKIISAVLAVGGMRCGGGQIPYQEEIGHYGWHEQFNFYEKVG